MDRKTAQIMDRLIDTNSDTLITAYETRLHEMAGQKVFLTEQTQKCGKPIAPSMKLIELPSNFSQTLVNYGLPSGMKTREQC